MAWAVDAHAALTWALGPRAPTVLGELAVPHRQDAQDEPPIELVAPALHLFLEAGEPAVDFAQRLGVPGVEPQVLEGALQFEPGLVLIVALGLVGEAVESGEGRSEHDAGVVPQRLGQHVAVGQILARCRLAPRLDQRDAGLTQRVETGGNRQRGRAVERLDQFLGHPVFSGDVEGPGTAGQLDDVGRIGNGLEAAAAVRALDNARDPHPGHVFPEALGQQVDELLAAQDALGIRRVHDRLLDARQPQPRACHDHRSARHVVAVGHGPERRWHGVLHRLREQLGEPLHGSDAGVGGRRGAGMRRLGGPRSHHSRRGLSACGRCRGVNHRRGRQPVVRGLDRRSRRHHRHRRCRRRGVTGRVETAQGMVERDEAPWLGVVRVERDDPLAVAEHVVDEALERLLGSDLDKGANTFGIERLEPLHPHDRRGDLQLEERFDLGDRRRVEAAGHVGDDGELRRRDPQAVEHDAQRAAGRRDDPRVEGVAHGQPHGLHALAVNSSMARLTASLAPPITTCVRLLMLAGTT